jgi:hypothetical protein
MTSSVSPHKRRILKTSNKKYSVIFDHREQLQKQKDFFKSFKAPKKSETMWKYNIKNHFEYSIVKIQLWWRAIRFFRLLKHLKKYSKQVSDVGICMGSSSLQARMAACEDEQNIEKIQII